MDIKALAVLCAYQCAVDIVERCAEFLADLLLDSFGRAFIVFIEKKVGFEFFLCGEVALEKLPAYAACFLFASVMLCYAPVGAWAPSDQ